MAKKAALRPGEPIGEALRAIGRDVLSAARAAMTDPARANQTAVHEFRRAMKQWRSLLRLIRPLLGEDAMPWRSEARDLARVFTGARDGQSALNAIDDLAKGSMARSPRLLASIRTRLEAVRREQEAAVLTPAMRQQSVDWLDAAAAFVDQWRLDAVDFDEVAKRITSGYRAARRLIPDNWRAASAEDLHELRGRVVDHRYQIASIEPLWPHFGRMWVGEAERLRDRLGKYQDIVVLERLAGLGRPLARWHSRLAPACTARKAKLVGRTTRDAERLFAERPKAFQRRIKALWEAGTP